MTLKFLMIFTGAFLILFNYLNAEAPTGFQVWGKTASQEALSAIYKKELAESAKEIKTACIKKIPVLTDKEKEKGYFIWGQHCLDLEYGQRSLTKSDIVEELFIFASRGEYEPLSFSIYALDDLKNIKVTISDFTDKIQSASIKKENIDIRVVENLRKWKPSNNKYYENIPLLLEKKETVDLPKSMIKRFWITLRIPENATPTYYKTVITISPENKSPSTITLWLKVLPFELKRPEIAYGTFYYIGNWPHFYPGNIDKYLKDMKEHGMTTNVFFPSVTYTKKDGKILIDIDKSTIFLNLRQHLRAHKAAGFSGLVGYDFASTYEALSKKIYPPYSKESDELFKNTIKNVLAMAKEEGFSEKEIFFCGVDESGDADKMKWKGHLFKLFKEIPGAMTSGTLNGMWYGVNDGELYGPVVDIRMCNFITPQIIKSTKDDKDKFFIYNCGSNNMYWRGVGDPRQDRFFYGLHTLKTQADGCFQWIYMWPEGYGYAFPSKAGPVPTICWEAVREGCDDAGYFNTLALLIKEARNKNDTIFMKEAQKSEDIMQQIMDTIPVSRPGKEWEDYRKNTAPEIYDINRWKIATEIIKLQQLLNQESK